MAVSETRYINSSKLLQNDGVPLVLKCCLPLSPRLHTSLNCSGWTAGGQSQWEIQNLTRYGASAGTGNGTETSPKGRARSAGGWENEHPRSPWVPIAVPREAPFPQRNLCSSSTDHSTPDHPRAQRGGGAEGPVHPHDRLKSPHAGRQRFAESPIAKELGRRTSVLRRPRGQQNLGSGVGGERATVNNAGK